MKKRFHFAGKQKREAVSNFLAKARIGVVPSRWDNYPYACMEMMASGLPVIVSPNGGMAEMISDGYNGWIADEMEVDKLSEALERALNTPASVLAEMGKNASIEILRICDPQTIFRKHMKFKQDVVKKGAHNSLKRQGLPEKGQKTPYNPKKTVYNDRITIRKILSKIRYRFQK